MKSTLLALLLLLFTFTAAQAQQSAPPQFQFKDFSATMVMSFMAGHPSAMKVYRRGDLMRVDLPRQAYVLTNIQTLESYMVVPGHCMKISAHPESVPDLLALRKNETVKITRLGTATVDGHPTVIENIVVSRAGKTYPMKAWIATDLHGFPIQITTHTSHGDVTVNYKDVQLTAPPASLMQHPDGCMQAPDMGSMHLR